MRINRIERKPNVKLVDQFRKDRGVLKFVPKVQEEACESRDLKDRLQQAEEFATEFLLHSVGSLEWEQLRRMAKDILRRSGDNKK